MQKKKKKKITQTTNNEEKQKKQGTIFNQCQNHIGAEVNSSFVFVMSLLFIQVFLIFFVRVE